MNHQPPSLEAIEAAFAEVARARAETRRIHDAGEAHHADTCPHCQTEAIAKAFRDLANALADALTPMLDALRKDMDATSSPKRPANGPTRPQQRAPRDHPTNTGLAARSRTRQQGGRNALRRL